MDRSPSAHGFAPDAQHEKGPKGPAPGSPTPVLDPVDPRLHAWCHASHSSGPQDPTANALPVVPEQLRDVTGSKASLRTLDHLVGDAPARPSPQHQLRICPARPVAYSLARSQSQREIDEVSVQEGHAQLGRGVHGHGIPHESELGTHGRGVWEYLRPCAYQSYVSSFTVSPVLSTSSRATCAVQPPLSPGAWRPPRRVAE